MIAIVIRKQYDIDSLLRLRLGRLSDNSEISIWVFFLVRLLSHVSKKIQTYQDHQRK